MSDQNPTLHPPERSVAENAASAPIGAPAPRKRKRKPPAAGAAAGEAREASGAAFSELGLLDKVLAHIRDLSRPQRAALLSLIVLVAAMSLTLRLITDDTPDSVIVIIGLLCGTVPLITYSRDGLPSAIVVFAFTLGALFLSRPSSTATETPVTSTPEKQVLEPIYGMVYDAQQQRSVLGAKVAVNGSGHPPVVTSSTGAFRLDVPRYVLRNDTVQFVVQLATDHIIPKALRERPFTLMVNSAPLTAASAADRPASVAARSRLVVPLHASAGQETAEVRVIVDSIRTLATGTASPVRWEFEVEVNDEELEIPEAAYSARPGLGLMLVGGEKRFRVDAGEWMVLEIGGKRRKGMFFVDRVAGTARIPLDSLRPDVPVRRRVEAVMARTPERGSFLVFLTLIRTAPPPRPRAGKRG